MRQLLVYTSGAICLVLAACSLLQTSIAPKAAAIVSAYCQEPQASRLTLRAQVATLIVPNQIEIHCVGDQ